MLNTEAFEDMSSWNGRGLSQTDLMIKDECILVDESDKIVGHASKLDVHKFTPEQPRGILHRAFSVFLFNDEGKLLLQQRAKDKITFPGVWTNSCCSHQLFGFSPSEVDDSEAVLSGSVEGAKAAAIRKLDHELGISPEEVPMHKFKFLTRLHYWAADVVTHGPASPWGEHEMDFILFIKANVHVTPNPEEVADFKYVTKDELFAMMDPASGLIWSPWFRIIAEKFLVHWWNHLDATLNTNKYVDNKIHRFDPTTEHMGGGGNAREWLGRAESPYEKMVESVGDKNLKQGAYGKVKIHKHSLASQLVRVDEIFSMVYYMVASDMKSSVNLSNDDVRFCDEILGKVSRSFAAVIRQLPKNLVLDILVFYLALRALDTIEDDMQAFKGRTHEKIHHLQNFYKTGLVTPNWSMDGVGEGDEKVLLQQYFKVVNVFKSLTPESQEIIADITKRMGEGMADTVERDLGQGTVTVQDYNMYCHYVAGLVGEGLSRLFTASGYESHEVAAVSTTLANTMGLFLQKTNIIRDYLEDFVDGRAFWPQEIWNQYSVSKDLGEFAKPEAKEQAVHCLNHLITDALECVPDCLQYMSLLKTEEVFRFCAIPQVMAIATLRDLYNNHDVFTGVVKIRKGLAVKLILDSRNTDGLHKWFYVFAKEILAMVPSNDPCYDRTVDICNTIILLTEKHGKSAIRHDYYSIVNRFATAGMAWSAYSLFGLSSLLQAKFSVHLRPLQSLMDYVTAGVFMGSSLFMLGYKFLQFSSKKQISNGKK